MIVFPDLHRTDTMTLPAIAAISAITSAILFGVATAWYPLHYLAIVVAIPAAIVVIYWVAIDFSNVVCRLRWAKRFDGCLSARQALRRINHSPQHFLLYVQFYAGFDRSTLLPAAVLEDISEQKRFAIFPPSHTLIQNCKSLGVIISDASGNPIPDSQSTACE